MGRTVSAVMLEHERLKRFECARQSRISEQFPFSAFDVNLHEVSSGDVFEGVNGAYDIARCTFVGVCFMRFRVQTDDEAHGSGRRGRGRVHDLNVTV